MVLGLRVDLALVEGRGLVGMVSVGHWEMFCVCESPQKDICCHFQPEIRDGQTDR